MRLRSTLKVAKLKSSLIGFSASAKSMGYIATVAGHFDTLLGPGVTLLYPLYSSVRAIENPTTLDDQQWLTYWVIYSLITLFEVSTWKVLQWVVIWPYVKLMLCMWLVLPAFNGAAYIYERYVHEYVKFVISVPSTYSESQRKALQIMSLDARKSVERYIDSYGLEAFERVVRAAENEARRQQ